MRLIFLSSFSPLKDLTQYNTAHNRQISMVGIQDSQKSGRKRKSTTISFSEEEEIINMEDIDPTVGKFRNMVSTTIIPKVRGGGGEWEPSSRPFFVIGFRSEKWKG